MLLGTAPALRLLHPEQHPHGKEVTHLMDQVGDLVFSPLLACGLVSFFLGSKTTEELTSPEKC